MSQPDQREEAVFEAALQLPADQRAAYLDRTCAGDPETRRRAEALLGAFERAGGFMKQPATPERTVRISLPPAEKPGDRIGRYKLLQQIGEGGCGVVYMAEQEEPVRRRVALKVIKLGMDTKSVIARFEAERQALAIMDHPNIAKVLDAGATDTGRPYFVMELVRGIKITEFCDQKNLSTRERLDLFIQVCRAVQHAHQKGIIHRDLKPSNILVTSDDGVPVPKVIDFGIAKATQGRLTDHTVFTAFEQFIGTPAYMSPEQAEMSLHDIDTRTDIYSLGVLLYELLTGRTPFDAKELLAAGLDAMRRTIREVEPVKPSTRLTQARLANLSPDSAPSALRIPHSAIADDLDWIVMKALEKDRARRYETANGLAADLTRHLNDEPVVARPPSKLYRFQKLARRNKLAFAASAAIATVLVLGAVVSTWQAIRATRSEREQSSLRQQAEASQQQSETDAAKATAISDFLQQMLGSANPDALKGSEYTVRQLLDDFSAGLANQLEGQPEAEAAVRATIGRAYYRLGVADKALAHHERALTLRRRIFGEQAGQVAESHVDCAWACFEEGQLAKGESYVREALDIYRKRGSAGQPVISALLVLQRILIAQERFANVDAVTEEALTLARKTPGVEFPELASMIHGLSEVKNKQSKYAEAESLASKAVAMHRRLRREGDIETAWALWTLGVALRGEQKLDAAEAAQREALELFRRQYAPGHKSVDLAMGELKAVLEAKGNPAGVEKLYREVLTGQRAKLGNESPAVAETLSGLASLQLQGKQSEAEKTLHEALDIILKLRGQELAKLPPVVRRLAEVQKSQGKPQDAEKLYEETIQVARQGLEDSHPALGELLHDYGEFLNHEGKWEASAEQYIKSLPIRRAKQDDNLAWTLRNLGGVLIQARRPKDAEPYFRESLGLTRKLHQREDIYGTAWTAESLADALYQQRKLPEAERFYREALVAYSKTEGIGGNGYTRMAQSMVRVLKSENKLAEAEDFLRDLLSQQRELPGEQQDAAILTLLPWLAESTRAHLEKEEFARAEPLARECLASSEKLMPENWLTFDSRSVLGGSLLGQKQYAAAEPLLLSGYEGMKQREPQMPLPGKTRLKEALQRLVKLFEETGRTGPAAEWRQKLAELDKARPLQPFGIPQRETQYPPNLIDLSALYNAGFEGNWHNDQTNNDLAELPVGIQALAGTQFDVRGLIQLRGAGPITRSFPEQAAGLPTRPKARRVHFLHGVIHASDPWDTVIGKYVVHYADGTTQERPLVLGKDVLDWWVKPPESAAKDGLNVAWTGHNGKSRSSGLTIQLYKTTWENPTPEVEITSIDFVSAKRNSAPFLVAITVE